MTERIFVTYSLAFGIPGTTITPEINFPIYNPGTGVRIGDFTLPSLGTSQINLGYHQTLNYIDSNGNHFIAEGFPTNRIDTTEGRLTATFAEEFFLFGETNTDSEFGAISTIVDTAQSGHLNRPSETLATGGDLSSQWAAIEQAAQDVNGNFEYRPLSQNSNTFVAHALEEAGLSPATGTSDSGETFNSPGTDQSFSNRIPTVPEVIQQLGIGQCFLAGTMIDMWPLDADLKPDANGNYDEKQVLANMWQKPIEQITKEDIVVSPDEDGRLRPGRVTRTMQNRAKYILDFHGLKMTPGHATFCAEGKFAGQHVPILDILRSDGCVMKSDGTIIRAATNCTMGSLEDKSVWVAVGFERNGNFCASEKGRIRLGTRMILDDGHDVSLFEHYTKIFGAVDDNGFYKDGTNIQDKVLQWPLGNRLPKPEDYIMQKSRVTLEDIYQHGEWERAFPPQMSAPFAGEAGASYKPNPTLQASAPPNIPLSMENSPNQPTMTRKQRRAYEAKQRKASKQSRARVH